MKIERYPPFNVLQTLLVVARCGNFTAASQQLFLSQSAVSRHIQQIEEYFGCALFVRHTRMVVQTAECQRLVPIVEAEDLKHHTLLHSSFGRRGWILWLQQEGNLAAHTYREQVFDTLDLAFSAAARGLGVALGDLNLVGENLTSGSLVTPFKRV